MDNNNNNYYGNGQDPINLQKNDPQDPYQQNPYQQQPYQQDSYQQDPYQQQGYQQDPYQQTQYQQNGYYNQYPQNADLEEPMSLKEWLITLLVMCIPCVNIVMMFVWAFGSNVKKSKANYFKARLIFMAIMVVLSIVFSSAMTAFFTKVLENYQYGHYY